MSASQALKAVKWSFAGELCARAIQPLVFIVMARLLIPADFGIMAAGLMAINFSQVFWEGGLAKTVIQRQTEVDTSASTAFWINIVLGLVIALLLFIAAPFIAMAIFHDAHVTLVLRVLILQILLGSLTSIPMALLQKDMHFNRMFWIRLATAVAPGLISIPLALSGWSYWALVAGVLVGQLAQTVAVWRVGKWRPKFLFDPDLAAEMFQFGRWSVLSGLLSWSYIWADAIIVGFYLGAREFGLYRTGSQFVTMVYALMFAPILPVLYSHFSGLGADRERIAGTLGNVMRILGVVALPLAFGMFTFAPLLERLFFGPKWNGIAIVLGVTALMQGYSWVVGADGEAYRALGKPSYETIVMGLVFGIYLVGYITSIHYGLVAFVWTRFGLALVAMTFHLYLNWRVLKVDIPAILVRQFFLTTVGFAFYGAVLIGGSATPLWQRFASILASLSIIAFIALRPEIRGDIGYLGNLVKRSIGSRR